jgi:hypothetical protein
MGSSHNFGTPKWSLDAHWNQTAAQCNPSDKDCYPSDADCKRSDA